jgi:tRNA U38,U39,U40 pseudouridine synthase TruA
MRLVVVTIPEDIHHFPGEGDWRLKSLSDNLHGQNFMPHHIRKIVGLLNIQSCLDIRKPQCNGSRHYITAKWLDYLDVYRRSNFEHSNIQGVIHAKVIVKIGQEHAKKDGRENRDEDKD